MRGRIVQRLWHHASLLPTLSIQFPSSKPPVRQFSALLCSTSSRSLGEASAPSTSDVLRPFQIDSGRSCLPKEMHSCSAPKSSTHRHDLSPFRLTSSSSSYRQCTIALSFAAPSFNVIFSRGKGFTSVAAKRTERRCWSCEHKTSTGNGLFCPSCDAIQPLDPTVDFFQIFSIDRSFKVDPKKLEQSYKSLQKRLHPDLAGSKSEREREFSAEQSAHVIQAYYILLRPLSRARYLLGLHGIKVEEEGTIEDPELLMEIMEIRESIDEIEDVEALKDTEADNNVRVLSCEKELESSFGDEDLKRAVSWVQRLAYFIKIGEEIRRKL